jgi:membrane-associated phospholipid phosphatase
MAAEGWYPRKIGRGKVIRTLDPRFPKPVLYQAELYPEFRLDPLPEAGQKGNMVDLTPRWPLGLTKQNWWAGAAIALLVLSIAAAFDRDFLASAMEIGASDSGMWEQLTNYGEHGWILYPAATLFVLTAIAAFVVRQRLWRLILWQFAALYAFVFIGVGLPSLFTALIKRAIGRARPPLLEEEGLYSFAPNLFDWTHQSFPSGHATTAFALALVLAFLAPRWTYVTLVLAVGIAISRVILGMHYPTDVVAGAVVGIMGAYLVRWWFAGRRWAFEHRGDRIVIRPFIALKRRSQLKRRRSAQAPLPGRP